MYLLKRDFGQIRPVDELQIVAFTGPEEPICHSRVNRIPSKMSSRTLKSSYCVRSDVEAEVLRDRCTGLRHPVTEDLSSNGVWSFRAVE